MNNIPQSPILTVDALLAYFGPDALDPTYIEDEDGVTCIPLIRKKMTATDWLALPTLTRSFIMTVFLNLMIDDNILDKKENG